MDINLKRRLEFERNILVYCTKDIEYVIAQEIEPDHFTDPDHKVIFDYFMANHGSRTDISKAPIHLKYLPHSETTVGQKKLLSIYADGYNSKIPLRESIAKLKSWKRLSLFKERSLNLVHRVDNWDFSEPEKTVTDIADSITSPDRKVPIVDYLPDYVDSYVESRFSPGNIKLLSTNIADLNRRLGGGLRSGKLYTLAARTGCGKTALATNIMMSAAHQGYHCLYVTIEMLRDEITDRIFSTETGISMARFQDFNFTEQDREKIETARSYFKGIPIIIDSESRGLWSNVEKKIRYEKKKRGLSLVVIDYIQQFSADIDSKGSNKRMEIDHMTGRLKQLSMELDFSALMLAQLNREVERDGDRPPRLSDLKESSSIEQDSDAVMLLFCTNTANVENGTDDERDISCKIAKNRSGSLGLVSLRSKLSCNKFYFN